MSKFADRLDESIQRAQTEKPVSAPEVSDTPKPTRQTIRDPNSGDLCYGPEEFINPDEKKEK